MEIKFIVKQANSRDGWQDNKMTYNEMLVKAKEILDIYKNADDLIEDYSGYTFLDEAHTEMTKSLHAALDEEEKFFTENDVPEDIKMMFLSGWGCCPPPYIEE